MNAVSLTPESMTLSLGGTPISGRVAITSKVADAAAPSLIASFIPNQRLTPNTTYTVNLGPTIADAAGNPLPPFASSFTTASGIDNFQPSVSTISPANMAVDVPSDTLVTVTFSEPMNPNTINDKTFTLGGPEGTVKSTYTFSNGNTVATLTPQQPLFAGGRYGMTLSTSISDLAGAPLPGNVSSGFTTVLAPGTTNLPTSATVTVNPGSLFANGQISTTVIISDIKIGGALAPNGTLIAVTAQPAFNPASVGGTISGSSAGAGADPRFLLFSTFGAKVTVSYTPPDLTGAGTGEVGTAYIQVASVDLDNRPVNQINSRSVSLFGIGSVTLAASPTSLAANGTDTSTLTITVKDFQGNLVPDGTRIGLTAAPIFNPSSAGGTIVGGTASAPDSRVQIFTTTGGRITATYRAPSTQGSGTAAIQAMTLNADGYPTALLGTTSITLTP
ncbi:MAG TPA: Ig-like domain-containing protein [Candidatus Manganitrophaceae bacterium]|nr:Ig-like domain-containing protein [Candidatus Manganitrophaceae bacterium]